MTLPRPSQNFTAEKLQRLHDAIAQKVVSGDRPPTWDEFFRVARCLLVQHHRVSLTTTYQSKYTLHRSIAIMSATAFWLAVASLVAALVTARFVPFPDVNWLLLLLLPIGFLIAARQFAASFADNWTLFGDTIVVEAYALVQAHEMGLRHADSV